MMEHKRLGLRLYLPLMLIVAAAAVLITWRVTDRAAREKLDEKYAALMSGMTSENDVSRQLSIAETIITSKYFDEPDMEKATENAMRTYIGSFGDAYAYYLTPAEYEKTKLDEDAVKTFVGAVLLNGRTADGLTVAGVYDDTPAATAGLRSGDRVTAVNDADVSVLGLVRAGKLLDGTFNGTAKLTVERGDGQTRVVLLERVSRDRSSAAAAELEDHVGHIKIVEFTDSTAADFKNAVESLAKRGVTRFVVDLRGNAGGSLNGVLDTLDFLLPEGELALTADRTGSVTAQKLSDTEAFLAPMTVITDGYTADCAELFAAVLREYGRAQLVGGTTYGKWLRQETVSLSEGAVILSTASYRTPGGQSYEGVGVEPDVVCEADASVPDSILETARALVCEIPLENTEI